MKCNQFRIGLWMAAGFASALATLGHAAAVEAYCAADMTALGGAAPGGMEVEWQSVSSSAGSIKKAWVRDDLILIETDSHSLLAIRRVDGFQIWRCDLTSEIRFSPAVSRTNIMVDVDNYFIAIDKRNGNIRWKLTPDFIISAAPLLVDPPLYPNAYTNQWQNLESIYTAGWDSRMHGYWSRGKMVPLIKGIRPGEDVIAPAFDLMKQWVKPNSQGSFTLFPPKLRDETIYYTSDNNYVYAVPLGGEAQETYYMMGPACTELTVTPGSIFVGSRDLFVYCIDRVLLRKRWYYAPGKQAVGTIFADELQTPLVYIPIEDGSLQAIRIISTRVMRKGEFETPEHIAEFWKTTGDGVVTAGPRYVYVGQGRVGDHAYKNVSAVDKENGKTVWTESSGSQYLEYANNWSRRDSGARIYAVATDGRITSFKEKRRDTGILIAKMPVELEVEPVKLAPPKMKEEATGAPAKPDEKKPDAAKPEEKKPEAPAKPDEKKPEDAKPDEKKPDETK